MGYYLFADYSPLGVLATAKALNLRSAKILQNLPDHVEADARTGVLNVADPEWTGLRLNRRLNEISLRTARRFDLPGALLELGVTAPNNGEEEVNPGREVVFAVMPTLGTAVETFVIVFLRLLDEAFEADVAAHFVAVLVKRQQRE